MKTRYAHQKSIQRKIHMIKIYFDIIKKDDIMKIYFIKYKVVLIDENIFSDHMNFYFCNISATIFRVFFLAKL